MKARFKDRGYADEQVNTAFNTVFQHSRKRKRPLHSMCPWILKQGTANHSIKKHWHILTSDPQVGELYKEPTWTTCHRGRSLKYKLTFLEGFNSRHHKRNKASAVCVAFYYTVLNGCITHSRCLSSSVSFQHWWEILSSHVMK